jgi:hypothetical protein
LRRRAAMLERHAKARDPLTGKSAIAVSAGRRGGRTTADRIGAPSAWGLRMSLKRWHGVELPPESRSVTRAQQDLARLLCEDAT